MPRRPSARVVSLPVRRNFTCVAINLDVRHARWRLVRVGCRLHRIEVQRFAAHTGADGRRTWPDQPLTDGEVGLWSSFVSVLALAVSTEFLLVLEDDAMLLPGFNRHVRRLTAGLDADVAVVQLGWLGDSSWRLRLSPAANVRKVLRPRSRWRAMRRHYRAWRAGEWAASRAPLQPGLLGGTHALLLRTSARDDLAAWMGEPDLPLDKAMARIARQHPGTVLRSRRNLAWQAPFHSDIAKRMETPVLSRAAG